jgi:hypothetical protein
VPRLERGGLGVVAAGQVAGFAFARDGAGAQERLDEVARLEGEAHVQRRQGAERLGRLSPESGGRGVVDRAPVGVLGRFGVGLARQPAAVPGHDQRGLGRFEVTPGVGAPPQAGEVPVGPGDTQPQADPQRLTVGVCQGGLGLFGHGQQGGPQLQDHAGVLGDGGELGQEQRDPRGSGVAGADEGVQRVPQGGQRGRRVQVPDGHGLERLDLRLLGGRQPGRDRLQQGQEAGWPEPLLDLA